MGENNPNSPAQFSSKFLLAVRKSSSLKSFVLLVISYGLNGACYYTLSTLISQIIKPTLLKLSDYTPSDLDTQIGYMGSVSPQKFFSPSKNFFCPQKFFHPQKIFSPSKNRGGESFWGGPLNKFFLKYDKGSKISKK